MELRNRVKELKFIKAKDLQPNPRNWRRHPKAQREALSSVLQEVGIADAVLAREVNGHLELIDGHLRSEIAPDAQMPVLVLDVTEDEANTILATLDPLAGMAEADTEALKNLVDKMRGGGLDGICDRLAKDYKLPVSQDDLVDPEPQIDKADELQQKWGTSPGQLWEIVGKQTHRLLCGDAAEKDKVLQVLAGHRASLVFTDPPYGVSVAAKNRMLNTFQKAGMCLKNLDGDDDSPEALAERLLPAFRLIRTEVMADDCTVFVTAPQGGELGMTMMMMMQNAGLRVRHVLIWKKNCPTFSMGRLDYDYQHEPILLTWGKRHKRPMKGEYRTSIWEIDKPRHCDKHPTMKPVELVANALLNNSDAGDMVWDSFVGSGTSILACEQLGRHCYGIEIEPRYVAVSLERMTELGCKCHVLQN